MEPSTAARSLALGRVVIGAALLVAPQRITTPWVGPIGDTPGGRVLGNVIGIRDLVIGAGQLGALARGKGARAWLVAGAAADLIDLVVTVRAREDLPALGVAATTAMASTGAIAGAYLQAVVD